MGVVPCQGLRCPGDAILWVAWGELPGSAVWLALVLRYRGTSLVRNNLLPLGSPYVALGIGLIGS